MTPEPTQLELIHAALSQSEATVRAAWDMLVKLDREREEQADIIRRQARECGRLQADVDRLNRKVRGLEARLSPALKPRQMAEPTATVKAWFAGVQEDDEEV